MRSEIKPKRWKGMRRNGRLLLKRRYNVPGVGSAAFGASGVSLRSKEYAEMKPNS